MRKRPILALFSPLAVLAAGCGPSSAGDKREAPSADTADAGTPFVATRVTRFDEPWAMAFIPGTRYALVTERRGKLKLWQEVGGVRDVTGVPKADYGGQGGLGDVVLAPDHASSGVVYLSWAEAGPGGTSGAAVGRAQLVLGAAPRLEELRVIWRQQPKVTGQGHFGHRIAFAPDGRTLFISSGDRQKFTPAQDRSGNLGKIVRLLPDGTPAPGNPFAGAGGVGAQIWSYGHRNLLGLAFDEGGRLWGLEHGPAGGDELNLIKPGRNYGWPLVSDGNHYGGGAIPRHRTRPEFAAPAISWNPVIAPGDFIFYRGAAFPGWRGQAIIGAMKPAALVRVAIDAGGAREVGRHPMPHRIRDVEQTADGTIWLLEDGREADAGWLLSLSPRQ